MPLLSTNALPFAVSAIFAGAICPNARELVQITAAAAMAANVLDIMTEYLPLLVAHTRVAATTTPETQIYSRRAPLARIKSRDQRACTDATPQEISTRGDASGRTPKAFWGKSCDGGWKYLFQSCCSRYWCNCLRRSRHFAWSLTP